MLYNLLFINSFFLFLLMKNSISEIINKLKNKNLQYHKCFSDGNC